MIAEIASDVEDERALLGCMLLGGPAVVDSVCGAVSAGAFRSYGHAVVFRALAGMREAGVNIDALSLFDWLEERGQLFELGPTVGDVRVYLDGLAEACRSVDHWEYFAGRVRQGWERRQLVDLARFVTFEARGTNSVADILDAAAERMRSIAEGPARVSKRPLAIEELIGRYPRLREPVIEGLLRRGETANVIAAPKVGKSWLSYAIALCKATGRALFDRFAMQAGRVLLLDNELHPETIANRIPAVASALGLRLDEYAGRIEVLSLRGKAIDITGLGQVARKSEAELVIVDAYYRTLPRGTSENDNAQVMAIYNQIDQYADRGGAAWMLIHHASKGTQAHKGVTDVGAGAGAQARAADTHLVFRQHEEERAVVLEAAVRSWPAVEPVGLRWEFPLWVPDASLSPVALKGRLPRYEERIIERDREGMHAILGVLIHARATASEIRQKTGLSKDRCERLLNKLQASNEIAFERVNKRGNECREYHVVD